MQLYFESSKQLLDSAFKTACRKALQAKAGERFDKFRQIRLEEAAMVSETADYLTEKLKETVKSFPEFEKIHSFYKELVETSIDLNELKKALGHFSESQHLIKKLKYEHLKKLHAVSRREKWQGMSIERKRFFARTASIVSRLKPSIEVIKKDLKKLKELPKIDEASFTVVLAGFPNSGKTTMLKRLTGSEPLIASYAFTTKSIMQGFFEQEFIKVQVLDTPGLLDRLPEERNQIEKKAASALRHFAKLVVFIIDASKNAGYDSEDNLSLLEKLRKEFFGKKFFAVLNKCDNADERMKEKAEKELKERKIQFFEEGKGIESNLKEEIVKEAKESAKMQEGSREAKENRQAQEGIAKEAKATQ
jgi:nucleolar GTP-binding protein